MTREPQKTVAVVIQNDTAIFPADSRPHAEALVRRRVTPYLGRDKLSQSSLRRELSRRALMSGSFTWTPGGSFTHGLASSPRFNGTYNGETSNSLSRTNPSA